MYILQNQQGYFLTKSGEWADGREPTALFRTQHKDEALNQLFETNSKDYELRIHLVSCNTNPKGVPILAEEQLPEIHDFNSNDGDVIPLSTETVATTECHNDVGAVQTA